MKRNENKLLKAKEFYQKAIEEYERAKKEKSDVLFRNSAEKGWNTIVLSTNYLIEEKIKKKVKSNKERRLLLYKIGEENDNLKRYKFYERFAARAYILHMNCFYDGIYTVDELEDNLKKVNEYIKDVEKVVK